MDDGLVRVIATQAQVTPDDDIEEKGRHVIRLVLAEDEFLDVDAEMLTFADQTVVLWSRGTEVGRHRLGRIEAVVVTADTRKSAYAARIEEVRKAHPKAYSPWTDDEDQRLAGRYAEGAPMDVLVEEFGRQPGGIRSRLHKLGVLEDPSAPRTREGLAGQTVAAG